jgi:hypothetical protein
LQQQDVDVTGPLWPPPEDLPLTEGSEVKIDRDTERHKSAPASHKKGVPPSSLHGGMEGHYLTRAVREEEVQMPKAKKAQSSSSFSESKAKGGQEEKEKAGSVWHRLWDRVAPGWGSSEGRLTAGEVLELGMGKRGESLVHHEEYISALQARSEWEATQRDT